MMAFCVLGLVIGLIFWDYFNFEIAIDIEEICEEIYHTS